MTIYVYKKSKDLESSFLSNSFSSGKSQAKPGKESFQIKTEMELSQGPSKPTEASNTFYYWRDKTLSFTYSGYGSREVLKEASQIRRGRNSTVSS